MARVRLPQGPCKSECELAADPYTRKRPYVLALRDALDGRALAAGQRIHLSGRTIETWGNAADPQRSPLQVLDELFAALLSLGATPEEIEPAVALLARRIGRELVPCAEEVTETVTRAAAQVAAEAGEGVAAALEAIEDGDVDDLELQRSRRELADIRTRATRLEEALERAHEISRRKRARQSSRP